MFNDDFMNSLLTELILKWIAAKDNAMAEFYSNMMDEKVEMISTY